MRLQAKRQARKNRMCGLTERLVRVVVAAYVLSGQDVELARAVGRMLQEQLQVPGLGKPGSHHVPVQVWHAATSPAVVQTFAEPGSAAEASIREEALKWVAQVRAARWVRDENVVRHRVAAAPDVALQYVSQMTSLGVGGRTVSLEQSANSPQKGKRRTMRKWCKRFRERWHISRSRMSVRDVLPKAALETKASKGSCSGEIPKHEPNWNMCACSKCCEFNWHPTLALEFRSGIAGAVPTVVLRISVGNSGNNGF